MEIETGRRREVTEPALLQELIEEIKGLRRETAGYTYLFKVLPEDTEEFEKDLEANRMGSLQLKFSDHGFAVAENATIAEERDIWILADLRFSFQIIREKDALIVYGKKKAIPLDYKLKYESGMQTITTATTQPDTIGTWPPDESYPNKELVRERSRSEIYPMGRNAHQLTVINYGPGNLYALSTTDGVIWSYAESVLEEGEKRVFIDVYALALRTNQANTRYTATEYSMESARVEIRGISTAGYKPRAEDSETINYLAYIALSDTPGSLSFTHPGIAPGTEVRLFDISTGNQHFITEAGYDAIVKDMWISFTQPVRWRMYSYYHSDYCCQSFFDAFAKPLNVYPFGYQKSSLVPLASEWKFEGRVKNLGNKTMYGKAWLTILKKSGSYYWR